MSSKVTTNFMNNNLNSLENFHGSLCAHPTFAALVQSYVLRANRYVAGEVRRHSKDGLQIYGHKCNYPSIIYTSLLDTLTCDE